MEKWKIHDAVETSLNKGVVRGKLSEQDRDAALARVTWSSALEHVADVDLADVRGVAAIPLDVDRHRRVERGAGRGRRDLVDVRAIDDHAGDLVVAIDDVENCAKLMAAYCRRVRPDTDFTPRVTG